MSDVFEKNIEALVKQSALPADDLRRARARSAFLRAAEPAAPPSRSPLIAAAAAALLVGALAVWSVRQAPLKEPPPRTLPPPDVAPAQEKPARGRIEIISKGGNAVFQGKLSVETERSTWTAGRGINFTFSGRTPLPDFFQVKYAFKRQEESYNGQALEPLLRDLDSAWSVVLGGQLVVPLKVPFPAPIHLELSAPDSRQDMPVLEKTKIREADRVASFQFQPSDPDLLGKLVPQLQELDAFLKDAQDFVVRVATAASAEQTFEAARKDLFAEGERLRNRAAGMAAQGLYPAAANHASVTIRTLTTAMLYFSWKDGKFAGVKTLYKEFKPGELFGKPFSFDSIRGHLDDAAVVAGREFDLWIVRELDRGNADAVATIEKTAKHAGVAEFAERIKVLWPGGDSVALVSEIRKISK